MPHSNDFKWYRISSIEVPEATRVIAFHCHNTGGSFGIRGSVETSIWTGDKVVLTRTDTDWRCSGVEEPGWETTDFRETEAWGQAVIASLRLEDLEGIAKNARSIWNKARSSDTYCRKEIDIRTFMTCTFDRPNKRSY